MIERFDAQVAFIQWSSANKRICIIPTQSFKNGKRAKRQRVLKGDTSGEFLGS